MNEGGGFRGNIFYEGLTPQRRAAIEGRFSESTTGREVFRRPIENLEHQALFELFSKFKSHVVFEDRDIVVIHKPGNTAVDKRNSDLAGVLEIAQFYKGNNVVKTHLLDRETSGALVLAKNNRAQQDLSSQFRNSEDLNVKSTYLAILDGHLELPGQGIIVNEMLRGPRMSELQIVNSTKELSANHNENVHAHAIFRPISHLLIPGKGPATLTEVDSGVDKPMHVRIIASDILGHPVLGDRMFNPNYKDGEFSRHMLHVYSATFRHPRSGEHVTVKDLPPKDFRDVIPKDSMRI